MSLALEGLKGVCELPAVSVSGDSSPATRKGLEVLPDKRIRRSTPLASLLTAPRGVLERRDPQRSLKDTHPDTPGAQPFLCSCSITGGPGRTVGLQVAAPCTKGGTARTWWRCLPSPGLSWGRPCASRIGTALEPLHPRLPGGRPERGQDGHPVPGTWGICSAEGSRAQGPGLREAQLLKPGRGFPGQAARPRLQGPGPVTWMQGGEEGGSGRPNGKGWGRGREASLNSRARTALMGLLSGQEGNSSRCPGDGRLAFLGGAGCVSPALPPGPRGQAQARRRSQAPGLRALLLISVWRGFCEASLRVAGGGWAPLRWLGVPQEGRDCTFWSSWRGCFCGKLFPTRQGGPGNCPGKLRWPGALGRSSEVVQSEQVRESGQQNQGWATRR